MAVIISRKLLVAVVLAAILALVRPSIQWTVSVENQLSSKILIVRCWSIDDSIGVHAVAVKSNIAWSFDDCLVGDTHFHCHLAVEDKRLYFHAYSQGTELGGYDIRWLVRDDGVYRMAANGTEESFPHETWGK
ncbi:unnamed protein product [Linum trigynum]|uniref:S-protein homolog n=1 Tax=Linum trigynum TaxID=586398 RepID=A0AAV2D3C6_9ROSI